LSKLWLFILVGAAMVGILLSRYPPPIEPTVSAAIPRPFVVFDGTLFHSKPDLSRYGVMPLKIIYVSEFGEQWYNSAARMQLPDEHKVKQLAREMGVKESLVVIDIEHWPLTGDPRTVDESVRKYQQIARWFHEATPALRIGFFGIIPMAAYGWSLRGPESSEYKKWQQVNDRLIPLAQEVEVVLPHTYTYYPDETAWVRFAVENIKEARRYGKPVYVFLWPQYTEQAGSLAGKDVPPAYWRLQLETIRKHADGVVIWGGWGTNGPEPWNEDAPWWQATKRFISRIDRSVPATSPGVMTQ
jgi:hypothetical protein